MLSDLSQITTPLNPTIENVVSLTSIGAGGFLMGREVVKLVQNKFDLLMTDEDSFTIGSLMMGTGILMRNPENRFGRSFILGGILGGIVNLALSFRK